MSDDTSVIRRVLAGEVDAFRVLVERYQGLLCGFVRNLTCDRAEGEDIAQEVFLAAYVNLRSYNSDRSTFSTWLLTIARNRCVNAWKKRRPHATQRLPEAADFRTPESVLAQKELQQQLDACLAGLPVEQQTVFVLAEIQGLRHEEIARIEGVRCGTVKSRLNRAKEKLRALLQPTVERP
jgi:RNA polymerase sigma-70 factor (ECF subfamily)